MVTEMDGMTAMKDTKWHVSKNFMGGMLILGLGLYIAASVLTAMYIPGHIGSVLLLVITFLMIVEFAFVVYFGKTHDDENELGYWLAIVVAVLAGVIAILIIISCSMEYFRGASNIRKCTEPATATVQEVITGESKTTKLLVEYEADGSTHRGTFAVYGQVVYLKGDKINICYSTEDYRRVRSSNMSLTDPAGWFRTDRQNPEILNM